jgi:hypothetical protein
LSLLQSIYQQLQHTSLGLLEQKAARQLFRQHTGVPQPPQSVAAMESDIVDACGGLPLALQITGARLFHEHGGIDVEEWEVSSEAFQAPYTAAGTCT